MSPSVERPSARSSTLRGRGRSAPTQLPRPAHDDPPREFEFYTARGVARLRGSAPLRRRHPLRADVRVAPPARLLRPLRRPRRCRVRRYRRARRPLDPPAGFLAIRPLLGSAARGVTVQVGIAAGGIVAALLLLKPVVGRLLPAVIRARHRWRWLSRALARFSAWQSRSARLHGCSPHDLLGSERACSVRSS